jgi:putative PIN family toxin of toxin-antitoxin system
MLKNVVLDSSVLVSAFLTRGGAAFEALDQARRGAYALCLSPIILEEVRRALLRPKLLTSYRHSPEAAQAFCDHLARVARRVTALPEIPRLSRDPDDDHVIAAALAAEASLIVTGDDDLLALTRYQSIRIVTVRDFLETLRE